MKDPTLVFPVKSLAEPVASAQALDGNVTAGSTRNSGAGCDCGQCLGEPGDTSVGGQDAVGARSDLDGDRTGGAGRVRHISVGPSVPSESDADVITRDSLSIAVRHPEDQAHVDMLLRITSELSTSLDRDRALTKALDLLREIVGAEEGSILLADAASGRLEAAARYTRSNSVLLCEAPSISERRNAFTSWVMSSRSAVVIDDLNLEREWTAASVGHSPATRSLIAIPVVAAEESTGVVVLADKRTRFFAPAKLAFVEAVALHVGAAIHNARLLELIRQQAEALGATMRNMEIEVAKNQSVLESIADGILVTDRDGMVAVANTTTAAFLNASREHLLFRSLQDILAVFGESGAALVEAISSWTIQSEAAGDGASVKARLELDNRVIMAHVAPIFAHERFFGTVSIFRDVSREAELSRLKTEFLSTVSHELRTPMTSIKGYADLMLLGAAGELSGPQQKYLKIIQRNADRLRALADDLLEISRFETGQLELDIQPVDVTQAVNSVLRSLRHERIEPDAPSVEIRTSIAPELPPILADPEKFASILTNLIDNALNYTEAGDEVEVVGALEGDFVAISVKDTGIGIGPDDQHRIFERFFRSEAVIVRGIPGTGLGLSIVRDLVTAQGGTVSLKSELGKGSEFTFRLPRARSEKEDSPAAEAESSEHYRLEQG